MKIKKDKFIKVGVIYNAFDPSDMQRADLVYRKNTMLKTYLSDLPKDCDWLIGLNGNPIDLAKDGNIKLKPDDNLQLVVVPHGGDGVKSILRTVALVAVAVGASLLFAPGGALAFSIGAGSAGAAAGAALGMTAFTLAGSFLINAILPVKAPKTDKEDSQSYGYDGAKNTAKQGVTLPVVYGLYRVAGNYVDTYTQNIGDDQYLYGRTVLSDGRIKSVSKPLLNDQPIENYTNVDWGFTRGLPNEAVNPWFNKNTSQIQKSAKLTSAWVTHTTTNPVDQIQLNLGFTRGLVKFDDKGKKLTHTATIAVEYSEAGKNNWRPLGSSVMQTVSGDIGSGSTPDTTKLQVQVKPTLITSGAYGANYVYTVKYRKVGETNWTVFKTVNDVARGVNYEIKDFTQEEISGATAVYSPADEDHTYEWAVPQGQYQIAVEGGSVASYGYLVSTPSSSTYSYSDNRAKSIRKTIESGQIDYGVYDVRVRKTSSEGDNEKTVDEIYLTDIGEITNSGIAVRNIANAYYKIKMNEQLNGVPAITWLVEGVEVNKYNIKGDVIAKEWSDNPAWIILDMLIGEERGTPGMYSIDFPMFLEWADWCESQGLKFNGVFDSSQTLWDACVDVLKVGHASFSRIGTKLSLTIDKPQEPVMLFGPGNIFKDTFKITYLPMSGRANEFELSYFDRNDNNVQKTIRIVDPEADQRGDIPRPVNFSMPGIDNYTQAQKEIWYQLYNNRYLRRTITFDAPIESIGLAIGEVALIQHDMMNWGTAGRLTNGSTATSLKLDKMMTLEAGKTYSALIIHDFIELARTTYSNVSYVGGNMVRINNLNNIISNSDMVKRFAIDNGPDYRVLSCSLSGASADLLLDRPLDFAVSTTGIALYDTDVVEERDVVWSGTTDETTNTLTISSGFNKVPAMYANYMAGEKTIVKKPYRLKSLSGTGFDKRSLTFTEYNPSIYNPPEYIVPQPPTTQPKGVTHISELQYVYDLRSTEANTVVTGVLSWNASNISNYGGVDIYVARNGSDFVFSKTILNASETQLDFNFGDNVKIKAVAFNTNSVRAPIGTAPVVTQSIVSGGVYLDTPKDITVKQISYLALGVAEVTWTTPTTALSVPVKFRVQLYTANGNWDEYAVTSENLLRIGDLVAGSHTLRIRTERGEAYSKWSEKTFNVATNSNTIQPGATVGGTVGVDIKNPDGTVWVPPTGSGGPSDTTPPAIPTNLAVTSTLTDAGVDVVATWTAPSDADVAGYDISIKEGTGSFIDFMSSSATYKWTALKRNTLYTVKVRAFDKAGNRSGWTNEVAITAAKDSVPPASVTNVTVETAYNTAFVTWTNPNDADLARVELRLVDSAGTVIKTQSVSSAPGTIGKATWSNLNKATTYSCYLLAYDTSGNEAIVTNSGNFTTAGGIDLNDFTPGLQPISTVANLPTPNGYTGPTLVFNQADGKLYRYKNGNWAKEVDGYDVVQGSIQGEKLVDGAINNSKLADGAVNFDKLADNSVSAEKLINGAVNLDKFADGLNPVERVSSLPGAGKVGRVVLLTTDNKIYRDTGSSWTKAVDGGDVVANSITANAIAAGAISADKIAAKAISAEKLLIGDTNNYANNASFETGDFSGWLEAHNFSITSDPNMVWKGKYAAYTNASFAIMRNGAIMQVNTGDNILAFAYINQTAGADANGSKSHVRISGVNKDGSEVWVFGSPIVNGNTGRHGADAFQRLAVPGVVPAGVVGVRVEVVVYQSGGEVVIGATGLMRRSTGELIVDGTISADKIASNAITTDKLAANSISANKLMIGSRPFSIYSTRFWVDTNGYLQWTGGYVQYPSTDGGYRSDFVNGGGWAPGSSVLYIFYRPGAVDFSFTYDETVQNDSSVFFVGKWHNNKEGPILSAGVGTLINGEQIITNSIRADRIIARTITADQIAANAITANELAANSITAGKLTMQTKPISVSGCNIRVLTNNILVWDAGTITFPDSNGNYITRNVTAGSQGWAGWDRPVTFCYNSNLDNTGIGWIYFSHDLPSYPEMIPVAIWNNGSDLSIKAGVSTVINGDRIVTGSINADKIVARSISADRIASGTLTANEIAAGTITAAQIATGALTARVLAVGNSDSIIGDSEIRDASWWSNGNSDGRVTIGAPGFPWFDRAVRIQPNGGIDILSMPFVVEPGATYKVRVNIYMDTNFSGNFAPYIHVPGILWYSIKASVDGGGENYTTANQSVYGEFNFDNTPYGVRYSNIRFAGDWSGTVWFACSIVRISDSTLIKDGAITTNKITVNSLNGDRIQAGTLSADKIAANTVISNTVWVGSVDYGARQLETIVQRADNPANRINQVSTQIDPGKILISGGTSLANWRNGGDNTKIEGGALAANTITANKLTIGNRGIGFIGLNFEWNPDNNYVNWSQGYIYWQDDNNNPVGTYIAAGNTAGAAAHRFIYWNKGDGFLSHDQNTPVGDNKLMIATWWGGSDLNVNYGGTIINGDRITTGTIDANRIKANTILANNLVISGTNTTLGTVNAVVSDPAYYINRNQTTIDGGKITTGSIDANRIAAYTILSNYVQIGGTGLGAGFDIGAVALAAYDPANRINNGTTTTINGGKITTGSIEANKLNVGTLSAITANIGTLRTATSGGRMEIENNQIRIYDDGGNLIGLIGRLN